MEPRKLIKFGNSSHVVSLPNGWLKRNKLNKGDVIYFSENGDNEIIIRSSLYKEEDLKQIRIDVSSKSIETIEREIVAAYINNNDIIEIFGNLADKYDRIKELLANLMALEVIEETPKKLIVRDFLNIKDVSIDEIIRRMDIIIRSMLIDSKESIIGKNKYEEIRRRDSGVNKFRFLLYKVINKALGNPNVAQLIKRSNNDLLFDIFVVWNLEDIADETRRVAKLLLQTKLNEKDKIGLHDLYSLIESTYLDTMKAYFNRDIGLAHKIASKKEEINKVCDDFLDKSNDKVVWSIIRKLGGMGSFVRNISRLVIDHG